MAEVTRRSFDLKSWQGLTDVLRFARESNADPAAYAEFRNLVLHYAQQKGSDPELKKKIETIIASFTEKTVPHVPSQPVAVERNMSPVEDAAKPASTTHGRRLTPSFVPPSATTNSMKEKVEEPTPSPEPIQPVREEVPVRIDPEPRPEVAESVPVPDVPPPVARIEKVSSEQTLKSIEEHRVRIMEIKRRVNGLIGNPIMLMDHGNHIGREYMGALLNALKATSPGSTLNVEETMKNLELMFTKIVEVGSHPEEEASHIEEPEMVPEVMPEVLSEVSPVIEPVVVEVPEPEIIEEKIPEPIIPPEPELQLVPESIPEPEPILDPEPETLPDPEPEPQPVIPEEVVVEVEMPPVEEVEPPMPPAPVPVEDKRWSESGGDSDIATQIKALREQLKATEMSVSPQTDAARVSRPIIPSIIDMEEEPTEQDSESTPVLESHVPGDDEMSTQSLAHRPLSSLTGITLGTPQAELMTPEVTAVLTQLLHDWNIFASSGLFGMGPSGMDHPLYAQLSRLPMGEVLSGRFENGDMKLVRMIKDYVNAWRHEQGVAYNPTETFEHYLRRVSQRILKRQMGTKTV